MVNGLFFTVNASQVVPYYLPQPSPKHFAAKLKIFHLNIYGHNHDVKSVSNAIKTSHADIVSLQEYNDKMKAALETAGTFKQYPYHYKTPWGDDGLYSKLPFESVRTEHIEGSSHGADTAIIARIRLGQTNGAPVTILASHPPTPLKEKLFGRQQAHFQFWANRRKSYDENLIVIGDLNTAPWSYGFKQLLKATGLRDSQMGFGIQPSFPVYSFLKGVAIDHCLISKNFIVLNRQIGKPVGSDHYPVTIELGLQK